MGKPEMRWRRHNQRRGWITSQRSNQIETGSVIAISQRAGTGERMDCFLAASGSPLAPSASVAPASLVVASPPSCISFRRCFRLNSQRISSCRNRIRTYLYYLRFFLCSLCYWWIWIWNWNSRLWLGHCQLCQKSEQVGMHRKMHP